MRTLGVIPSSQLSRATKSSPKRGFLSRNVLHGDKIIGLLKLVLKALVPLFGVFGASRTGKTMAVIYGILMPLIEKAKGIAGTIS